MSIIDTAAMVEKNTIVALEFNRKDPSTLAALKSSKITITRVDKDNQVVLAFETGAAELFTVAESDLDFEEIRGRTGNLLRTIRQDSEKIILQYEELNTIMESDSVFFYYAGNDEFIMMSEPHFKVINKVYSPKTYNPTDISISDDLMAEIEDIREIDNKGMYSKHKSVRYRNVIFKLDDIIKGTATNELRNEALNLKKDLEEEIRGIRTLKSKAHLSKAFQDTMRKINFDLMAQFILKHHGKAALSDIESKSIKLSTEELKASDKAISSAMSQTERLQDEIDNIDEVIDKLTHKNELTLFINRALPPKVNISLCSKCGNRPRLNVLTTNTKTGKAHEVRCRCGEFVTGTKIAIDSITKWNLKQGTNTIDNIEGLSFENLSQREVKDKIGEIDKFTHMVARKISLRKQTEGDSYHKKMNKVKGMNNVLMVINGYVKEIIKNKLDASI